MRQLDLDEIIRIFKTNGISIIIKKGRETRLKKYFLLSGFHLQKTDLMWAYGHAASETEYRRPYLPSWKKRKDILFWGGCNLVGPPNFIECLPICVRPCQCLKIRVMDNLRIY